MLNLMDKTSEKQIQRLKNQAPMSFCDIFAKHDWSNIVPQFCALFCDRRSLIGSAAAAGKLFLSTHCSVDSAAAAGHVARAMVALPA